MRDETLGSSAVYENAASIVGSYADTTAPGKRGRLKRVATGLACIFFATASFAACSNTIPVLQERKESQVIIIGTVMSSRQVPQAWDSLDGTDYVVHIDQKVKGKQTGEITIFSERSEDGFNLEAGKQYLLFLTNNYQHWVVNKCGNSGPIDEEGKVIKQMVHAVGND
jgi:hypothetical protein